MKKQLLVVQNLSYGDATAYLFLWLKTVMLVPLWAIPIIPIVGFISRGFGHGAVQVIYGLTLLSLVIYFMVDVLKRRIRLDDHYLFFGIRAIPIASINSIDVLYKKSSFLPTHFAIATSSGERLKLSLQGLSDRNVEIMLKHIGVRNSNLKIAAVLNTLIKCRQAKPMIAGEPGSRVEIPYRSRKIIDESVEVFKSSARRWGRLGPILTLMVTGPIWLTLFSLLFMCLQPNSFAQFNQFNLLVFLFKFMDSFQHLVINTCQSLYKTGLHAAANNIMVTATGLMFASAFIYMCRLALRPTLLIADQNGVTLFLKCGQIKLAAKHMLWADIASVKLLKPSQHKGPQSWKISFIDKQAKNLNLDFAALESDDRTLLLRQMEKSIPNCQIDYELSQSLVAKADKNYTELWLQSLTQAPERKKLEPLQPGQIVGDNRFEVLGNIGVGGQGTAYLCRSPYDHSLTYVLKETIIPVFGETSLARQALEKFDHEAKMLQSLNSDGIVKLLDYFVEDHRAYLLLEHIDGVSLRQLVQGQSLIEAEQVQDLALQMCDILKTLHAGGVIHRDFTPDNLILNTKGRLKLIDFNVAQQVQSGTTGTIVGKHAYLPPEQFRGKATNQSDLYALGATLFYLLTGRDPEPISQSSPRELCSEVSPELNEIVKKATALNLKARYETADQLASDLLAIGDHRLSTTTTKLVEAEVA